jgi:hypothetical protein
MTDNISLLSWNLLGRRKLKESRRDLKGLLKDVVVKVKILGHFVLPGPHFLQFPFLLPCQAKEFSLLSIGPGSVFRPSTFLLS